MKPSFGLWRKHHRNQKRNLKVCSPCSLKSSENKQKTRTYGQFCLLMERRGATSPSTLIINSKAGQS